MGWSLEKRLTDVWYRGRRPALWMVFLSSIYRLVLRLRDGLYRMGWRHSGHPGVPVIVVGNITAGGTGKTPLVVWLAELLKSRGFTPGVISRGHGSRATDGPVMIDQSHDARQVGDEPLLLARRCDVPVSVCRKRLDAANQVVGEGCNVVISDDGLQHKGLMRDIEIVVVDASRQFGNGRLIPAGPLRESIDRLKSVDFVVHNGGSEGIAMSLTPGPSVRVLDDEPGPTWSRIGSQTVHAVAAIGNPQRFFDLLQSLGVERLVPHAFEDHHPFAEDDFRDMQGMVMMTEKDAVKCRSFARNDWYYVPITAELPESFGETVVQRLEGLRQS